MTQRVALAPAATIAAAAAAAGPEANLAIQETRRAPGGSVTAHQPIAASTAGGLSAQHPIVAATVDLAYHQSTQTITANPTAQQASEVPAAGLEVQLAATPADDKTQHPAKPIPLSLPLPLPLPELRWDFSSDSASCCDAVNEEAGQGVADPRAKET